VIEPRVYRTYELAIGAGLIGSGLAIAVFNLGLTTEALPEGIRIAVMAVAFLMAAFVVGRVARSAIIADADGVTIRNPLRTEHVTWGSIQRFAFGRHAPYRAIGLVELSDGRTLTAFAIQAPSPILSPTIRGGRMLMDELETIRRQVAGELPPA
jgi:hypothetical protein